MSNEPTLHSGGTISACLPPHLLKPRLRRWEASQYLELVHGLRVAPSTLAKLACIGGGPIYRKAQRTPLYERSELDSWVESRLGPPQRSSSDAEAQAWREAHNGG